MQNILPSFIIAPLSIFIFILYLLFPSQINPRRRHYGVDEAGGLHMLSSSRWPGRGAHYRQEHTRMVLGNDHAS